MITRLKAVVASIFLAGVLFFGINNAAAAAQMSISEMLAMIQRLQSQIIYLQQQLLARQSQESYQPKVLKCLDGTAYGKCSKNQPKYCSGGVLIDNCAKCGCNPDENSACDNSGKTCQGVSRCDDGTTGGQCSVKYKSWYCKSGVLVQDCRLCGCTSNTVCTADGFCLEAAASVPNITKVQTPDLGNGKFQFSIETDAPGYCRYQIDSDNSYDLMTGRMTAYLLGKFHNTTVTGITTGQHTVYFRCANSSVALNSPESKLKTATINVTATSAKIITLNGGESLTKGNTYSIKWSASGFERAAIHITNYSCSSESLELITDDISAAQGSYSWRIPDDFFSSQSNEYCPVSADNPSLHYGWRSGDKFKISIGNFFGTRTVPLDESDGYFNIFDSTATCSEGTLNGQCSNKQPKYCNNGVLVDNCAKCGCSIDEDSSCDYSGKTCQGVSTCSDGTLGGECSTNNKPKYCRAGVLVDNCFKCSCPNDGSACSNSGVCQGSN